MQNHDIKPDETLGQLAAGGLQIIQKAGGYRFSIDSYLLAAFVDEPAGTSVLEIGSGSGVISILLAGVKKLKMTGVEVQPSMAEMSIRSVMINRLEDMVKIVSGDIKAFRGGAFGSIVVNPPYRPLGSGRVNPADEKAAARHEIRLTLNELVSLSKSFLKDGGSFYAIYPSWRLPDMICAMRAFDIEPKKLIMVHSHVKSRASLFLIKGIKGAGKEMINEAPIVVYENLKEYTFRMNQVFEKLSI